MIQAQEVKLMQDSDIEARKRRFEQDPEFDHKLATWIRTILKEVYDYNNIEVVKTEKKQGGKVNARQRH